MYKSRFTNRIGPVFAFCLGFSAVGVGWAVAQTAPREPVSPRLPSTAIGEPSPTASPVVAPKPPVAQTVRRAVPGPQQAAKEPEQMKLVGLYRGDGHFDPVLAEKLRPTLAKAFGLKNQDNQLAVPNLVRSMLGQTEKPEKKPNVTNTGQP